MRKFEFMEKFYLNKNIVENGGWGNAYAAYPTSPRDPPMVVTYNNKRWPQILREMF